MSCTLRMASGVSIMAHSRVLSGARASVFADAHDVGAAAGLRQQDGIGRRRHRRIEVGLAPGRIERVDADDQFARAIAARLDRGADLVARDDLGVGGDGVLQIEDQRIGGNGLGLLQRAGVGARHVEHAAARTDRHGSGPRLCRPKLGKGHAACQPDGRRRAWHTPRVPPQSRKEARNTGTRTVDTADVVIVGGGIVGSAVAYFLSTDAASRGRRIVLIERDPGYREASTARSAGGIRQQFSTPENIAMSQVTLEMFRRLKAIFGRRGGRGLSRAGLSDHGDARRAARCWRRTWRCSSRWAPTSPCSTPQTSRADFPGSRRMAWLPPASAGPGKAGSIPPASPRCCAKPPRQTASASCMIASLPSACASRVESVSLASGKKHRLPEPRQRGGAMGGRAVRFGGTETACRAAQALRLRHRLPRGVRRAASGAADGRSVRRMVPARGTRVPVRQIA